jgi:hypothetical protein
MNVIRADAAQTALDRYCTFTGAQENRPFFIKELDFLDVMGPAMDP